MDEKIILYTSNYAPLRKLTPERKALLFDSLFLYAIGEDLPEMDEITELAWGFLQNAIDHTREKAEEVRQKRSEAGRRHKGNQYGTNGTNVPNLEQTEQDGTNGTITKLNITKQNITKQNITEQNKTKHNITLPDSNRLLPIDEVADWYITTAAFQSFAVANNLTRPRAEAQLKRFVTHLHAVGEDAKTRKDFMTHLQNWTKYNQPEATRPAPPSAFDNIEPLD